MRLDELKIKIFADGADIESIQKLNKLNYIQGFTTNPSLMKKAGINNYKDFAIDLLSKIKDKPISFEVFSDELAEMEIQANEISKWGDNVNIKIPVTNTKREKATDLIRKLSSRGIACNVTALFTIQQIEEVFEAIDKSTPAILSIFAGRIADTGVDPSEIINHAVKLSKLKPNTKILWASTREILNIFQANNLGCHIITVPHDILNKLSSLNKSLDEYSLETVKSFYKDAVSAGFKI
tara:strand:- start:1674 stop:2387 length:714 start_codon:yes stop_codon:yes gene_type:complete